MTSPLASNLRRVRELLTPEGAWTQGEYARDVYGDAVYPDDIDACSWCLSGAIEREAFTDYGAMQEAVLAVVKPCVLLTDWNDHPSRTQPQVLAMLDRAIERAERAT